MLTLALVVVVFLSIALAVLYVYHRLSLHACDTAWRIALEFVAFEGADMPHEFAACYLAKNHDAMAQKFPQFADHVRDRMADWEAAE